MVKEYLGNDTYNITFSDNSERTLTLNNIDELIASNDKDLLANNQIELVTKDYILASKFSDYVWENTDWLLMPVLERRIFEEEFSYLRKTILEKYKNKDVINTINKITNTIEPYVQLDY